MNTNRIEIYQSSQGLPYKRFILIITACFVLLFLVLSIFNIESKEKNDFDWTHYLFFAGSALILGVFYTILVPDTCSVLLINDKISIKTKKKSQDILLTDIKRIETTADLWFYEFYVIEFFEMTELGKSVHFGIPGQALFQSGRNFGEILRVKWLRELHAAKNDT